MLKFNDGAREQLKKAMQFLCEGAKKPESAQAVRELRVNLKKNLRYLHTYAQDTVCELYSDFAPFSFAFVMQARKPNGGLERWFNGGLIFHGNHDGFGNGGGPTFSVCLNPTLGWSIHT